MGTAATPTRISGPAVIPGIGIEVMYTLALDTTTAAGIMTVDVTSEFKYIYSCKVGGSAASNGYYVDAQVPGPAVAATSTNLALGFYEAGVDGAELDLMNATDMSTAITVLTITVIGAPVIETSWA